jgi:cytochrome P450
MHFGRIALTSAELSDQAIAPGDLVTLWLSSGNRDEAAFPEPDRFDLARSPKKHLSLGHGRHFCIGSHLGRVEIIAMLDALRTFARRIEQTGTGLRIYSNFLQGISSLPVLIEGEPNGLASWQE